VELLANKEDRTIRDALKKAFTGLGYPKMIYSDAESAFRSDMVQNFLKKYNIRMIFTLTHAPVAERTIETIKNMLMRRIDKETDKWWEVLPSVVEDYNKNHVSSATGMTPEQAGQFANKRQVKINLEKIRHNDNDQPALGPLDEVRIIKKKSKFDKGYVPQFSDKIYTVKSAKYAKGRTTSRSGCTELYGDPPPKWKKNMFMRHELQLVKKDTTQAGGAFELLELKQFNLKRWHDLSTITYGYTKVARLSSEQDLLYIRHYIQAVILISIAILKCNVE
jgi:hypothetical protein